jgi:hypothetical protein
MLKFYENVAKSRTKFSIKALTEIGLKASKGRPDPQGGRTIKQMEALGLVGIWIEVDDNEQDSSEDIVWTNIVNRYIQLNGKVFGGPL